MNLGTLWQRIDLFRGPLFFGCAAALTCFALAGCGGDKSNPAAEKTLDGGAAQSADTPSAKDATTQPIPSTDKGSTKPPLLQETIVPAPKLVDQITIEELYPNKKVMVRRQVKHFSDNSTINHGLFSSFYLSDAKFEEGNYIDGKKDGPWKLWHENGQLAKTENYVNGQLDGQWSTVNDKGVRQSDVSFKAGKRDGKWVTYGDDGKQIREQQEYRDGKLNGTSNSWSADGKKLTEMHFENGQPVGLQQEWFPNGQLSRQVEYKDGKFNGKLIRWNDKGEKLLEEEYVDGKLIRKPATNGK
jgi:antitoxin component YwqK of YwqJK toxin-antitoxin module